MLETLPALRWPLPDHDPLIAALPRLRPALEKAADAAPAIALASVKLKSPVANPSKIIAAPVNYTKHLQEARADAGIHFGQNIKTIDHYGVFLKANSSLSGASEPIAVVEEGRRTDHELELAAIIGREGASIAEQDALSYVAGYSIGLDMTIRGPEERSLRKSLDRYAVLGPYLVTPDEIGDPGKLDMVLTVNGEVRQKASTAQLIFSVPKLIAYCSTFYTLKPGDVIMTGTPEGVGPVKPGDVMMARIDKVGEMTIDIVRRDGAAAGAASGKRLRRGGKRKRGTLQSRA